MSKMVNIGQCRHCGKTRHLEITSDQWGNAMFCHWGCYTRYYRRMCEQERIDEIQAKKDEEARFLRMGGAA